MPIGNLGNKVSRDDVDTVKNMRNPPEYEPGFEPTGDSGGDDFADLFGDISFDSLDDGTFGSGDSLRGSDGDLFGGGGVSGNTNSGTPGGFGSGTFGGFGSGTFGGFGSGVFGNPIQNQQQQQKTSNLDKAIDAAVDKSGEAMVNIGHILIDMIKSIKNRNADDFAYYSRNLIMIGGIMACVSLAIGVLGGAIGSVKILSFKGLIGHTFGCGLLTIGTGLSGIGFAAIKVANMKEVDTTTIEQLPDISEIDNNDVLPDYEENVDDILDDLFSDESLGLDDTTGLGDSEIKTEEDIYSPNLDNISYETEEVDYSKKLDEIHENQYITRELLFKTFKSFFKANTPTFADKKEINEGSDDFATLETICLKALANVAKCEVKDVSSRLESATESYFSYELRLKRVRGVNKIEDIAREIEAYFRSSSTDKSVNATVDIEGDFYKIIVTKGVTAVVTFGDIFKQPYVCEFFLNEKNKLPLILGISELGEVLLEDGKTFDTMMIAGKPRSGKSWYVLSILLALMLFNTPEQVQFIIVDPKESNLFNTMSLMPHVCGLHNDKNILEVMQDIIENEGARRKKILADNRCDDIWALWKKGIKLPILYLVIDEVMTVKNNLGPLDKQFNTLMQTIISQLPSQGIRIIFVPHRATGVVDKTNRTMISFSAAIRSTIEEIKDTLAIKAWDRELLNPGDIAIKSTSRAGGVYVRGAALTTDDDDNTEFILNAAKVFYKMGVDLPDMSSLQVAANRDEEYVREQLSTSNNRVQYNANNIFDYMDDI